MLTINEPELTINDIDKVSVYRRKWQEIALNRETINRDQARLAIENTYSFLSLPTPSIIFFENPFDAIDYINREIDNRWGDLEDSTLGHPVATKLLEKLLGETRIAIKPEVMEQLRGKLDEGTSKTITAKIFQKIEIGIIISLMFTHAKYFMKKNLAESTEFDSTLKIISEIFLESFFKLSFLQNKFVTPFYWQAYKQFINISVPEQSQNVEKTFGEIGEMLFAGEFTDKRQTNYQFPSIEMSAATMNVIVPSITSDYAYYIDFYHEVLGCDLDSVKWNIFKDLITSCGWIFPYEKTILVCDR